MVYISKILEPYALKICIVTQSYYPKPGGVTEVAHYTAVGLRRRGHDVTIVTTHFAARNRDEQGIIRIGRNFVVPVNGAWVNVTGGLGIRRRLREIFEREHFEIIQTHCPLVPTLPLQALMAAGCRQKVVGTFHAAAEGNIAYRIFQKPLRKRACRLDHRIAVSNSAARFAGRYFPGDYEIIPNGIDCSRFHPDIEPLPELKDGRLNILFVGRMDRRKGLHHLIKAIPIAQKRLNRKMRLLLIGEEGLRNLFRARPFRLFGAEIRPVGRISPSVLPRYYASADIFCSPATGRESFGIILLEAMASGIPIIASDIEGYRGVLSDGVEGFLVPPRDPERIADALLELANDPLMRKEMGKRGRAKSLVYDWAAVVDMLELSFLNLLDRRSEKPTPRKIHQTVG